LWSKLKKKKILKNIGGLYMNFVNRKDFFGRKTQKFVNWLLYEVTCTHNRTSPNTLVMPYAIDIINNLCIESS
jgi:hypothetical protein